MSGLYRALDEAPDFEVGLVVMGAHLSPTYGMSVREIEADAIDIVARVETLLDSDSRSARLQAIGIALTAIVPILHNFRPDLLVYPGDREDVLIGAMLSAYLRIPSIHFFGGDHSTDGIVDNPVRHAASKMSSIHFVTHEVHRDRLIAMGEAPERCYLVGSPALDKFRTTKTYTKEAVLTSIGVHNCSEYALVIFHPLPGHEEFAGQQFEEILRTLKELGYYTIVSYPNIDSGSKRIIDIIQRWKDEDGVTFYRNLSREVFINVMRHASFMIGNSSAGILEAPSLHLPAINVGERQKERLCSNNVLFVDPTREDIVRAVDIATSQEFRRKLEQTESPFGDGHSVERCVRLLREIPFDQYISKIEDPLTLPRGNQ